MRAFLAGLLGLVGCLLGVVSLFAMWAHDRVLDDDGYVSTVRPLASDPAVQDEVASRVSTALLRQFDTSTLAPAVQTVVRRTVERETSRFMDSASFQELWVSTNRSLHRQVVADLRAEDGPGSGVRGGELQLDLTDVVDAVRKELVSGAVPGLQDLPLPRVGLVVDVADAQDLRRAHTVVTWLDRLARVAPVAAAVCLGLALLLARRRLRALGLAALGVAVGMGVSRLVVELGGIAARHRVPTSVAGQDAVDAVYAQLTSLLRRGADVVGVVALVVAVVALLASAALGRRRRPLLGAADPVR